MILCLNTRTHPVTTHGFPVMMRQIVMNHKAFGYGIHHSFVLKRVLEVKP